MLSYVIALGHLWLLGMGCRGSAAASSELLRVLSPENGGSYEVTDNMDVPVRVQINLHNLKANDGALAKDIKRNPQGWYLCISWDLVKLSAMRHGDNHPELYDDDDDSNVKQCTILDGMLRNETTFEGLRGSDGPDLQSRAVSRCTGCCHGGKLLKAIGKYSKNCKKNN